MHPPDAYWQALLDDEVTPTSARAMRLHRGECADCQRRYAALEAAGREQSDLLALLDVPVPSGDVNVVLQRARVAKPAVWNGIAAAIASLMVAAIAAASVTFPPLRETMVRAWHRLASSPEVPAGRPRATTAPVGIAIEPGARLDILFRSHQAAGEVLIRLKDDSGKVLLVATRPVKYSVRSAAVVISNDSTDGSYDITIPRNSPLVTVRIAGERVFVKEGSKISTHIRGSSTERYVLIPFSAVAEPEKGR